MSAAPSDGQPPRPSGTEPGEAPNSLVAFGLLWFAYFATVGMFNPYAPLWFKSLGLSTLAIGAMSSLQAWTRLLAPYAWSWLADHSGQRVGLIRWAARGTLAASFGLLLLAGLQAWGGAPPWLTGVAAVAVLVALLFIANGGIVPLAEAALAQRLAVGSSIDAGRYGRIRVWGSLGFIAAVGLAGVLLQWLDIFAFPLLVVALNIGLVAAANRLPRQIEHEALSAAAPTVWPQLRRPEVAWFLASVFFTVLAHVSVYAFLSLFLDSLGYGKSAVGALWAVSVACEVVFFLLQGRFFGRWSPHRWLMAAAGAAALRFALTAAAGQWVWWLVLAQATHALTFAAHHAACIALISRYFPGRLRGRGQALYSALGYGFSGLVGGLGGGWLIEQLGFSAVFWASALSALLALVCVWVSARAAGHGHTGRSRRPLPG